MQYGGGMAAVPSPNLCAVIARNANTNHPSMPLYSRATGSQRPRCNDNCVCFGIDCETTPPRPETGEHTRNQLVLPGCHPPTLWFLLLWGLVGEEIPDAVHADPKSHTSTWQITAG